MPESLGVLVQRFKDGDASCAPVLRDLLLETGAPEHAVTAFINGIGLGPELMEPYAQSTNWRTPGVNHNFEDELVPFIYFDTIPLRQGRYRFFAEFQRPNGSMKGPSECNFTSYRRLPSYTSLRLSRISFESTHLVDGVLQLSINQKLNLELPFNDLLKRGVFGFPCFYDFTDRDDINAWVDIENVHESQLSGSIRLKLHGLLKRPVR